MVQIPVRRRHPLSLSLSILITNIFTIIIVIVIIKIIIIVIVIIIIIIIIIIISLKFGWIFDRVSKIEWRLERSLSVLYFLFSVSREVENNYFLKNK
jgi:hypothetical protein